MRILLTRPIEQSEPLAEQLLAKGIETVICPLMTIHKNNSGPLPPGPFQAIIFTSANSLRLTDLSALEKSQTILTVGRKTALQAQAIGFKDVISADGDLEKLSKLIKQRMSPGDGPLLYVRAKHVAGPLSEQLATLGFVITEHIAYETRPVSKLGEKAIKMLADRDIDFIPFYSGRSALIFKELVKKVNLVNSLEHITALAISGNVAREIEDLPWKETLIAEHPTQSAIFKLIAIDL